MSDRLLQQLAGVRRILQNTGHSLTGRVYSLSEQASFLLYLLEKESDLADYRSDLSALQAEVSAALLAALAEDPAIRLDETWGNTGALLDWLSEFTGTPWRTVEPDAHGAQPTAPAFRLLRLHLRMMRSATFMNSLLLRDSWVFDQCRPCEFGKE